LLLCALAASGCSWFGGGRNAATGVSAAPPSPAVTFLQADQDHDARITRQEFQAYGYEPERFDAVDLNGNGVVTLDEWQTMENTATAVTNRSRAAAGGTAPGTGSAASTRPSPSGPTSPLSR
jgi:hypothetical protein